MRRKKTDVEKERYWRKVVQEAARSQISVREFCRQRRLNEHQFYWWRQRLSERVRRRARAKNGVASFALVSEEPGNQDAGIELVLDGGRRLRIGKGVDEAALRVVLQAMERQRC